MKILQSDDCKLFGKFSATFSQAEEFYEEVEKYINKKECLKEQKFTIKLGARELVTNAITHGSQRNSNKEIYVELKCGNDFVEIKVKDQGCGFDRSKINDSKKKILTPGGRGYKIIKKYFDEINFNEKGNIVKITKKLDN